MRISSVLTTKESRSICELVFLNLSALLKMYTYWGMLFVVGNVYQLNPVCKSDLGGQGGGPFPFTVLTASLPMPVSMW